MSLTPNHLTTLRRYYLIQPENRITSTQAINAKDALFLKKARLIYFLGDEIKALELINNTDQSRAKVLCSLTDYGEATLKLISNTQHD